MTVTTKQAPATRPQPTASADTPSDEEGRTYSAGDVRVLVLDDDPAIGRLVQAAFADHDFRIDAVADPNQMENALRAQTYHIVVLDYVIPGLESEQIMDSIRETQ